MKITIHGSGYVGLVAGTCLADLGHDVICFDTDKKKIESLNKGFIPIFEPGLEQLVKENKAKGNLRFSNELEESVCHATVQFIAVGTPSDENGSADIEFVLSSAKSIANEMKEYKLIVTKSTVPVGTGEIIKNKVMQTLELRNKKLEFDVASNPEFLKEGNAVNDFMKPDRIVIGVSSQKAESILKDIYNPFVKKSYRIIATNIKSAELSKYAANAMLATRISFMNELSRLSEKLGADIEEVRKIIGHDSRIGNSFLYPGLGFGGSCFPKDLRALKQMSLDNDLEPLILDSVITINTNQIDFFINKIYEKFKNDIAGKIFSVWGLSFKPQTDDIRESPSLVIIRALMERGAIIQAHDPVVKGNLLELGAGFKAFDNQYDALSNADALIIATEWKAFWQPDFKLIASSLKKKIIFDGRNIYDEAALTEHGLDYVSIGRSKK